VSSSVHVLAHVGVTVAEQIGNFGAYLGHTGRSLQERGCRGTHTCRSRRRPGQRTASCQLVQHLRHAAAFQVIGGALVQKLLHVERCLAGACERVHAGVQARVQGGSERGVADLCVNRRIAFLKYLLFDFALDLAFNRVRHAGALLLFVLQGRGLHVALVLLDQIAKGARALQPGLGLRLVVPAAAVAAACETDSCASLGQHRQRRARCEAERLILVGGVCVQRPELREVHARQRAIALQTGCNFPLQAQKIERLLLVKN
jgi:hypothetical protein